ncbi:MAG: hypothetical protein Q9222_000297 [Ikaeria aurantiellina]
MAAFQWPQCVDLSQRPFDHCTFLYRDYINKIIPHLQSLPHRPVESQIPASTLLSLLKNTVTIGDRVCRLKREGLSDSVVLVELALEELDGCLALQDPTMKTETESAVNDFEPLPPNNLFPIRLLEAFRTVPNLFRSSLVCPDITQHPFDTGLFLHRDYLDELRPMDKNTRGVVPSRTLQSLVNNSISICTGLGHRSRCDVLSGVAGIQDALFAIREFMEQNDRIHGPDVMEARQLARLETAGDGHASTARARYATIHSNTSISKQ